MSKIIYILVLFVSNITIFAQQNSNIITLTLPQAIEMAHHHSPDVLVARHTFRSAYWNYRYFRANYLPSLTFTSTPYFDHSINVINMADGASRFIGQNQLSTDGAFTINQNIPLTGGSVFVKTSLQRLDMLDDKTYSYKTNPVLIGYSQSLFGYNKLSWDKRIEPIRYKEAKIQYVESLELVANETTKKFFNLAKAQSNLLIAQTNYANADTLYTFACGRYNIGTITENEMLQLEINQLTEESKVLNAQAEVDDYTQELKAYLGVKSGTPLKVELSDDITQFRVDMDQALLLAKTNSPDMQTMQRRKQESESTVAYAKASTGLKADLYMQFGLAQTNSELSKAYKSPLNQQYIELGIRIPILDWGRGKGQIRVAESNRDMVYTQIDQEQSNFEMNIMKIVQQFNLQVSKVHIAQKTDITAQRRAEVARRLYILGKSTILDLNASITEKDTSKRHYIDALHSYWSLYYMLRCLTLYDFEKGVTLSQDYSLLLK